MWFCTHVAHIFENMCHLGAKPHIPEFAEKHFMTFLVCRICKSRRESPSWDKTWNCQNFVKCVVFLSKFVTFGYDCFAANAPKGYMIPHKRTVWPPNSSLEPYSVLQNAYNKCWKPMKYAPKTWGHFGFVPSVHSSICTLGVPKCCQKILHAPKKSLITPKFSINHSFLLFELIDPNELLL